VLDDLIAHKDPDVIMVQEHWLTPSRLCLFESRFVDYFAFGSSGMSSCLDSGMLCGRPYGSIMTLVKKGLRKVSTTIYCEERFYVVKVLNCLFINVYFPCVGFSDMLTLCNDIIDHIWSWLARYNDCECLICGDFNANLDSSE